MRIIARRTLEEFYREHPDAKGALDAWWHDAKRTQWNSPVDITRLNRNARLLPNERAVFNIRGNNYRLVVHVNFNRSIVYIRFVGTHAQYDRINVNTI